MMPKKRVAASLWIFVLLFSWTAFAADYTESIAPSGAKRVEPGTKQEKKDAAEKNRRRTNQQTQQNDYSVFDPGSGPPSGSGTVSEQPQVPCPAPPAPRDITPPPAR